MQNLIDEFNGFFEGDAVAVVKADILEVTVGTRTLLISLPSAVGGQAMGPCGEVPFERPSITTTEIIAAEGLTAGIRAGGDA